MILWGGLVYGVMEPSVRDKVSDALGNTPPKHLNVPGNVAKHLWNNGIVPTGKTNTYNDGMEALKREFLINAARARHRNSPVGLSADAQAFDSLWRYITDDAWFTDRKWGPGVKFQWHDDQNKKRVKNKDGKTQKNSQIGHYEFDAHSEGKERVILFTWEFPYDQNTVDKMKKEGVTGPIDFTGFNEFRQYGEDGAIQMYKNDTKTGKRVWPRTIGKDELIRYLGELPRLQK